MSERASVLPYRSVKRAAHVHGGQHVAGQWRKLAGRRFDADHAEAELLPVLDRREPDRGAVARRGAGDPVRDARHEREDRPEERRLVDEVDGDMVADREVVDAGGLEAEHHLVDLARVGAAPLEDLPAVDGPADPIVGGCERHEVAGAQRAAGVGTSGPNEDGRSSGAVRDVGQRGDRVQVDLPGEAEVAALADQQVGGRV